MLATRLTRFKLSVLLNKWQLISCSGTVTETILGTGVLISLHPHWTIREMHCGEYPLQTRMTVQVNYILSVTRRKRTFRAATRTPSRISIAHRHRASTSAWRRTQCYLWQLIRGGAGATARARCTNWTFQHGRAGVQAADLAYQEI